MQRFGFVAVHSVRLLTVGVPLAVVLLGEMSWAGDGLAAVLLLTCMGVAIALGISSSGRRSFRTLARLEARNRAALPRTLQASFFKYAGVLLFLATLAILVTGPGFIEGKGRLTGLRGYEFILFWLYALVHGLPIGLPVIFAAFFMTAAPWVDFRRRDAQPDWRRLLLIVGWIGLLAIPVLMWMGGWMCVGGWLWVLASFLAVIGAWGERGIIPRNSGSSGE